MLRFLSITLCLLCALACRQNTSTSPTNQALKTSESAEEAPKNWQLNTSEGLNIHHPENWEVDLSGQQGSKFLLYFPEDEGDTFREYIMLTAFEMPDISIDLKAIGKICADQITRLNPKTRISLQQPSNDGAYYEMAYVGPQGNAKLMNYQRVYLAGSAVYQLTYSGDEADFSEKLAEARSSMDTFSFP